MGEMVKRFPRGEASGGMSTPGGEHDARGEAGNAGSGQSGGGLQNVAGQAGDIVSSTVTRRAERSAGDIDDVARALRQTRGQLGDNFAGPYVEAAADQLTRLSQFLRTTDARQMVRGVERFARREPLVFLGGAFALGMIGARFLKSSSSHGSGDWQRRGADLESGGRDYTGTSDFGAESVSSQAAPGARAPDYGSEAGATSAYGPNTGPRGAGEVAGTGMPDVGITAPDPRGDYPPNSPPGGPYPGSGVAPGVPRTEGGRST